MVEFLGAGIRWLVAGDLSPPPSSFFLLPSALLVVGGWWLLCRHGPFPRYLLPSAFCLLPCLLLIAKVGWAADAVRMEFLDANPKGGVVAGVLRIEVLKSFPEITAHLLYWGGNPHEKLGNYRPLATRPVPETTEEPWLLEFQDARIPPVATHFVLILRDAQDREHPLASLPLLDSGVPEHPAEGVRFRQDELRGSLLKGVVRVSRAWDERDLDQYVVYWGNGPDHIIRNHPNAATFPKRGWWGSLWSGMQAPFVTQDYLIPVAETLPPEATHVLVYTRNAEGQMSLGVVTALNLERPPEEKTVELRFVNTAQEAGWLSGELKLIRTKPETASAVYGVYWGRDRKTRLEGTPPLTEFEIQGFRDGLKQREILVSSPDATDRQLQVTREGGLLRELGHTLPERTRIPEGATHLLVLRQQKLWFQTTVDRKQGRVLAAVPVFPDEQLEAIPSLPEPVILGTIPEPATSEEEPEDSVLVPPATRHPSPATRNWRDHEYRGLGIGLTFSGITGGTLRYHHNLTASWQLQGMLDYAGKGSAGLFSALRLADDQLASGTDSVSKSGGTFDVSRTMLSGSLRWFVPESWTFGVAENLYFGLMFGGALVTLDYDNTVATYPNPTRYQHQATAHLGFMGLDLGWQGTENYFLEISLMPSANLLAKDSFQSSSIPDERTLLNSFSGSKTQRESVEGGWASAKNPSRLLVGVGVAF